jgi:cytochrome P450
LLTFLFLGPEVGLSRVALKDYTFSDGTYIPRGTTVAVNLHGPHFDESIYENSGTFNPDRFLKEENGIDAAKDYERPSDMTTTSNIFLAFGNGRHACPGRFLAASQLKMMMAHVLINYDVKFKKEGVRPLDLWLLSSCIPNPNAQVLFRKRLI